VINCYTHLGGFVISPFWNCLLLSKWSSTLYTKCYIHNRQLLHKNAMTVITLMWKCWLMEC